MIESSPRALALGAVRPAHCPSETSPPDPCAVRYKINLPVWGEDYVTVPIYRMVDDALLSATQRLPVYLPQLWQQMQPYLAELQADVVRTIEYEVPFLTRAALDEAMPRVEELRRQVTGDAESLRDELLIGILAAGAASIVAIGVAAWWINQREVMRDQGHKE